MMIADSARWCLDCLERGSGYRVDLHIQGVRKRIEK
jgi:hypothetical protein